MARQGSDNCGRNFAKRKQSDAEFAGNNLLRMVIIHIVINTIFGRLTVDPAGMHCPCWDDAFDSSIHLKLTVDMFIYATIYISTYMSLAGGRHNMSAPRT